MNDVRTYVVKRKKRYEKISVVFYSTFSVQYSVFVVAVDYDDDVRRCYYCCWRSLLLLSYFIFSIL